MEEKLMKKFWKIVSLVVVIALIGVFAACTGDKTPDDTNKVIIASADDLWGKKIGVQLGTTGDIYVDDYTDAEKAAEANATVAVKEQYSNGAAAVLALNQGKIDCVVIDSEPAKAFVAKNEGLKILDEPLTTEEYAIAIAKGSELTAKINAALAELKADGTLDSIIKNYIGDDTKGLTPYTSPENVDRSNGELKMGTNAAFEPYEYLSDGKVVGIDADLAQAIADKLGMTLIIEDMEFDSIITAVTTGKVDIGVAGMTITEDRLLNVDFSSPYTTAQQVIIVKE